jgi:hypothetical protein
MYPRKLLDWRKALIYTHRWAGIVLTAVFVVWFVSGVIFVYVGMPTLPAEERLLRMEPLDATTIAVTPADEAGRFRLRREASHTPYAGWIKWQANRSSRRKSTSFSSWASPTSSPTRHRRRPSASRGATS